MDSSELPRRGLNTCKLTLGNVKILGKISAEHHLNYALILTQTTIMAKNKSENCKHNQVWVAKSFQESGGDSSGT